MTSRIRSILSFSLAPILPAQDEGTQLAHLREQLIAARAAADQDAAITLLQHLCTLQPGQPAFPLLLAETHASLGPQFDPRRAAELCQRFLAMTDAHADDLMAELTRLGSPRNESLRSLRLHTQALLQQMSTERPERLLLSPDRKALARKLDLLTAEHQRISADKAEATQHLKAARSRQAAAEAEHARARRNAATNQYVDLTELWTRVLDRREEVRTLSQRCERLGRELDQNRTELERHRTRLHIIDAAAKALSGR